MNRIIIAIVLLFCLSASAQIDQRKLDSLTLRMASDQKATAAYQDSFLRQQDSLYKAGLHRAASQNTALSTTPLMMEESEAMAKRKHFVVIEVTLLLLSILAISVIWRSKRKARGA